MIGKTISHYKILEKLGEGGMGVVYKAKDTKLKRIVALKFLPQELTYDSEANERFIQEAQAASALDHPNICTIYEIDETDDGQMFIAMAYYKGETIKKKVALGPLSIGKAVDIAIQVAEGLAKAHGEGIFHRDIKPANVIVTDDGVAKIVDFGLAKMMGASKLTRPGTTLGTVGYMSPEQARGEEVDHRTDIWSLGVILYEMLTGKLPFKGEYEQAMIYSILNVEPEPIKNLRSDIPMELEQTVLKMMKKEPAERSQDVKGILPELNTVRVSAAPSGSFQQSAPAQTMPSKGRWSMVIALFILILVVGSAVFYFRKEKPVPPSERKMLAVLPFENLGSPEDEYFADGITDEIMARLAGVEGLGVIARTSAIQYKNTKKTIQQVGEELGVEYILGGTVRWQRLSEGQSRVRVTPQLIKVSDATQLWANIYDKDMTDIFEVQSDIAKQVTEELGITLLEPERIALESKPTDNLEAYDYYMRGNEYFNRGYVEQDLCIAMQMYEKAIEIDPSFALAYARLSGTHALLYWFYYDRSEERIVKSKEAVDRALKINPDLPEAHLALGIYHYHGRLDYDSALKQFDIVRKRQPNNAELLASIGYVQRRQGKLKQAVANIKKAYELDPLYGLYASELGGTYSLIRNYPEAERYFDRAISLTPDYLFSYTDKAQNYLIWEGSTAKARLVLEEALQKVSSAEEPSFILTWVLLNVFDRNYQEALDRLSMTSLEAFETQFYFVPKAQLYAQIYGLMGNRQLKQAYYDSARSIIETKVQERPEDALFHSSLGIAYAGLDRREDAIREGKLAVELLPVSKEAYRGLYRVEDLAEIYTIVGEHDSAVDQLEYLLSIPSHISVPMLRLDPKWNPLRDHPRFKKILKGGK